MNMATMQMYCPSLKENVMATITEGKQVASKGGSLRNIIYGVFEGRKCLPKTVKAEVFAQHGFGAESFCADCKSAEGHGCGCGTKNAEYEDCEVCYATVDKGTLNDVQAGRICNECHRMNKYTGGTRTIKTPYNAESFAAEDMKCAACGTWEAAHKMGINTTAMCHRCVGKKAESFSAENRCSICSGTGHNSQNCPSPTMSICGKCGGSDLISESYYDGQIYCQKCKVFIPNNELKTVKNPKWKEMFGAESFNAEYPQFRNYKGALIERTAKNRAELYSDGWDMTATLYKPRKKGNWILQLSKSHPELGDRYKTEVKNFTDGLNLYIKLSDLSKYKAETFAAKEGFDRNCKVCKGTGWMQKKGDPKKDAKTAKLLGLSIDELTLKPCNAGGKDMGCFGAESFEAEKRDGRDMTLDEIEETYGEGRLCLLCFDGVMERGEMGFGRDATGTIYTCSNCGAREGMGLNAETFEAYDESITERQEYKIASLGGKIDSPMDRSDASDYIKELMGKKSGTWKEAEYSPSSFDISWEDAQGVSSPSLPPEGIHFAEGADVSDYKLNGEGCEYCAEERELNAEGFCSECSRHAEEFASRSYEDAFFTETVSEMAAEKVSRNGKLALSLTALGIGVAMALGSDKITSLLDGLNRK